MGRRHKRFPMLRYVLKAYEVHASRAPPSGSNRIIVRTLPGPPPCTHNAYDTMIPLKKTPWTIPVFGHETGSSF